MTKEYYYKKIVSYDDTAKEIVSACYAGLLIFALGYFAGLTDDTRYSSLLIISASIASIHVLLVFLFKDVSYKRFKA